MCDNEDPDQSTVDSAAVEATVDGDKAADVELGLDNDLGNSLNEMANSLCSTCRKFPRGQIEARDFRVYHPSLTSLRESVQTGCWICKELTQSLDELCDRRQLRETLNEACFIQCRLIEFAHPRRSVGDGFYLEFLLCDSGVNCAVPKFDKPTLNDIIPFFAADYGVGEEVLDHRLQTSTAKSTTSINVARYWYHQCLSHPTCRSWRQDSRGLPTRLVRIWRPDNDSPDSIYAKLCETKNLPLNTAYVTLSHLWGDNQIFKLQQSNIEDLRQSIRLHQLPRVFQDAIYVSIELGISYIWIDSLCIIQDSTEDWVHESRRMGDVYQYAACNISASSIQDGSLGLFAKRKALSRVYPSLFADFVLKEKSTGEAIVFKGLYIREYGPTFDQFIGGSILNSRAWVAQERALSPGIIHFTPEMMWWECNHGVYSEAFPTGDNEWKGAEIYQTCTIRSLTEKSDPEDIYAFWRKFIAHYAGKKLTFEHDRFPAAVGIARTLSGLIDDNFVAGFWEGDLIKSLIMRRRGRIEDVPDKWRAPSWSWASLRTGYDIFYSDPLISDAQPLSGVSVRAFSNKHGFKSDLDSASLEISDVRGLEITAPLRKLSVDIEAGFHQKLSKWFFLTIINHDTSNDSSAVNVSDDQAWRLRDPTHLLVLAKAWYDGHSPETPIAYALLVQQVPDAEEGTVFRRFGTAVFYFRSDDSLKEYFGLQKENDQYFMSPIFGECGFQEIVLI